MHEHDVTIRSRLGPVKELSTRRDDGIFLRREAIKAGYDDRSLRAAVRRGDLHRIRQGSYLPAEVWDALDEEGRHRALVSAVLLVNKKVVVSHTSAALLHGLPLWEPDLSRAHILRGDLGSGRVLSDLVHHEGAVEPEWLTSSPPIVPPIAAALGHAALVDVEHALVTLDGLLATGVTHHELMSAYGEFEGDPGFQHVRIAALMADGGAQSVAESRFRYLCHSQSLPCPELQFEVRGPEGLVGRTDFAWPRHGVLGEMDGRVKYGRYLRPGESAADAVFREKKREDRIRELTGWVVIRFTWADLQDPRRTAARIRQALRLAA